MTLLSATGESLFSQDFSGVQNSKAVAHGQRLYFQAHNADAIFTPGSGVEFIERSVTAGADVVAHGIAMDEHGDAMSLFNEGFAGSSRGYSFMSSMITGGAVTGASHIDGYVTNVWSCVPNEWSGAIQDMAELGDASRGPKVAMGNFSPNGEFAQLAEVQMAPGTELSMSLDLPCSGDSAMLLTVTTDPESEEVTPQVIDVSLWHLTASGAVRHPLEDWSKGSGGPGLALDAVVMDDEYVWITPEGTLHSAPVEGGGVTDILQLDLPQPLPASAVMKFTGDGELIVCLPARDGISVIGVSAASGTWTSQERITLSMRIPNGHYVSDVVEASG